MEPSQQHLTHLRKKIDILDQKMLAILKKRLVVCQEIALHKQKNNLPILQGEREQMVIKQILKKAKKLDISADFIVTLFQIIFHESKKLQNLVIKKSKKANVINFKSSSGFDKKAKKS